MARMTIKTIEERLATMKRADNQWAETYVRDVGHLLKERSALHANAGKLRAALEFYANPDNLEQFAVTGSNEVKGTSWGELDPDISNRARAVLAETGGEVDG